MHRAHSIEGSNPFLLAKKLIFSLKDISQNLNVIARSYDGLPEAVVMNDSVHPFMIAVQFHPERLGKDNAIHQQMRSSFFRAISN